RPARHSGRSDRRTVQAGRAQRVDAGEHVVELSSLRALHRWLRRWRRPAPPAYGAAGRMTATLDILGQLVAFDTTSRNSNLPLIEWVTGYLDDHGVESRVLSDASGEKANLVASLGPAVAGGVVLCGHTDVVPTDSQPWTRDPFT